MAAGSERNRDEALRQAAREQQEQQLPNTQDRSPRNWTQEGGMVEQQASAMAWLKAGHNQRHVADDQHIDQEPEVPEQSKDSPPEPGNDNHRPGYGYHVMRAENGAERESQGMEGPEEDEEERVQRVLADYDRNSGREREPQQQLPANDNIKGQARNYDDLKVEAAKRTVSREEEEEQRVQRALADFDRSDHEREQGMER